MDSNRPRIAVIGVGAVGVLALWSLARRGAAEVHGFDAYAPGHDRGGYGGQTRIFRVAYREGAQYVPLLQRSAQLWRQLESDSGTDLLTVAGGLTIAPKDHPDLRAVADCIDRFDLPHETLTATEATARFPHLPVEDGEEAILDHSAGVLRPELAVQSAARHAEHLGATIHPYTPVRDITPRGDGIEIATDTDRQHFDHVLVCPGPWSPLLTACADLPLEVHQITTLWFATASPQRVRPTNSPIVIRSGPIAFSCFPAVDGETVKVSLHSLPRPRIADAEHISRNPSDELVAGVRQAVRRYLPDLYPEPVRIGSYADCFTPDQHGIVGALPGLPNTTVLTGFSGHGFKLAPVFGEVAADLALTGATAHDIDHLSPVRFGKGPQS